MPTGTPGNVQIGPGWFYVAPVGTSEPTSASAAIPSAWRQVGYTEDGTSFTYEYTNEEIEVAEEFYPVAYKTTKVVGTVALSMAESNRQNLALALNAGANLTNDAQALEPTAPGSEVRVMGLLATDLGALWIFRQMFQAGSIEIARKKAPDKSLIPVEFRLEKPASLQPWKVYPNASGLI